MTSMPWTKFGLIIVVSTLVVGVYLFCQLLELRELELQRQLIVNRYVDCRNIAHPIFSVDTDTRECIQAIDALRTKIEK